MEKALGSGYLGFERTKLPKWMRYGLLGLAQFVLIPERRELRDGDSTVSLGSRALDILITLVTRHPAIVSKEELLSAVWPNRIVEENNLTVHMAALRRTLGDGRDSTRFVHTLHGRGYCFVAPITAIEDAAEETVIRAVPPPTLRGTSRLPEPGTPFIGRVSELAEIGKLLATRRMVTIAGMGGVGKTRLALRLGTELASRYADGVHLVELATIANPNMAVGGIARGVFPRRRRGEPQSSG